MRSDIISVQTAREVSAMLAAPNSRIIAGGTSFSPETGEDLHLVDISGLEGLDGIRQKGSRLEIGPLVTLSALGGSMLLKAYAPALAECAAKAAVPEIRDRGTLGGNLAAARVGDTAAALLASGAKLTIKTDSDYREILIDRFWRLDGENDLSFDEWITRITIQIPKDPFWGAAFGKIGEWDLTKDRTAAAAVQLSLNEKNVITDIRGGLCLGSGYVRRMFPLEKALKNRSASGEDLEKGIRAMVPAAAGYADEEEFAALLKDILLRAAAMADERRAI